MKSLEIDGPLNSLRIVTFEGFNDPHPFTIYFIVDAETGR